MNSRHSALPSTQEKWAKRVVACVFAPVVYPLFGIYFILLTISQKKKDRQAKRRQTPLEPPLRVLPTPRPRRLTGVGYINPQLQSTFITLLPVEIRLVIWQYVLGREYSQQVLHMDLADGILRYCRCFEGIRNLIGFRHRCWKTNWSIKSTGQRPRPDVIRKQRERAEIMSGAGDRRLSQCTAIEWEHDPPVACWNELEFPGPRNLCAAPMACKLIYNEAINVLYQDNTFDFRRTDSLLRLPKVIPASRFEQLRRIELSMRFRCLSSSYGAEIHEYVSNTRFRQPNNINVWIEACDVLASIKHLDYLHIAIMISRAVPDSEDRLAGQHIITILEPLQPVRANSFNVSLTETIPNEVRVQLGKTPYQILLRED